MLMDIVRLLFSVGESLKSSGIMVYIIPSEQKIDFFQGLSSRLWAQEVDKWDRKSARQKTPKPHLPSHRLEPNPACEHSDKAEEPFSKRTCSTAYMAKAQWSDLTRVSETIL